MLNIGGFQSYSPRFHVRLAGGWLGLEGAGKRTHKPAFSLSSPETRASSSLRILSAIVN